MSGADDARSDGDLVSAVAEGDQHALAVLYRRHAGAVWRLSERVCRDSPLADEICQTVFCDLWGAPGRFDPARGGFRPWLMAQAHARAVDVVRSETSRRRREEREAELAPLVSDELGGADLLGGLAGSVRRAVDELPPTEREAILLTYFGGYTYREAAVLSGHPEGTVKSRIRAGLLRLRAEFDAEGVRP